MSLLCYELCLIENRLKQKCAYLFIVACLFLVSVEAYAAISKPPDFIAAGTTVKVKMIFFRKDYREYVVSYHLKGEEHNRFIKIYASDIKNNFNYTSLLKSRTRKMIVAQKTGKPAYELKMVNQSKAGLLKAGIVITRDSIKVSNYLGAEGVDHIAPLELAIRDTTRLVFVRKITKKAEQRGDIRVVTAHYDGSHESLICTKRLTVPFQVSKGKMVCMWEL